MQNHMKYYLRNIARIRRRLSDEERCLAKLDQCNVIVYGLHDKTDDSTLLMNT